MSEKIIQFADAKAERDLANSLCKFMVDVMETSTGHVWATVRYHEGADLSAVPDDLEKIAFWYRMEHDNPCVAVFRLMADGGTQMMIDNETIAPTDEQLAWMRRNLEKGVAMLAKHQNNPEGQE